MQKFDVLIVGGGAAGLACAVAIKNADREISVAIAEAGERAGKKIAASGNGQGNLSNADLSVKHYHGSGTHLAENLCCSGKYDPLSLFDFLFVKDKLGRIYPAGKQASSLSDCLIRKVNATGVKLFLNSKVTAINKGFIATLSGGEKIQSSFVVIAAGGKAQKQFNTVGDGYALAQSLGHTVTELLPSLVQLKCDTKDIKTLKGIRAECRVTAFGGDGAPLAQTTGDVIFTDYGVSGNAAFYVSSYVTGVKDAYLSLEFLPDFSEEQIERDVALKLKRGYPHSELLCGTLHNQLGRAIILKAASGDPKIIARTAKNFILPLQGGLGFDYAQVTKGGVPASEVDGNLQSKKTPKLYFAGEVLDVDGDCGGYNLTWAFASGMHAGRAIVNAVNCDD